MGRVCLCFVVIVSWVSSARADWQSAGKVESTQIRPNGVELVAGKTLLEIVALSPSVVRLRYAPAGSFGAADSFAVLPNAFPAVVQVKTADSPEAITVDTGALRVQVMKSPLRVVLTDPTGQILLQDHPNHPVAWSGTEFRVWKSMPGDEHYFGLGDKAGPIDHRDQAFTMWNTDAYGWREGTDPLYKSVPFLMGVRGGKAWGLFLDNTFRSSFDLGKESRDFFSFGAEDGPLDYYFFYGPEPKKVLEEYTQLIGRMRLPPLWALGYQQSRYSYFPEARVREVAQEFRRRKIPADVIYLDLDYEDGARVFTIDRKRFPHFEGMVADLKAEGFQLVVITDLHLKKEPGYQPYDEGLAGDHFVKNPDGSLYVGKVWPGDCVFPDFTRPATRQWFGTLYADFMKMGIRGFWDDMNEPAVFTYPEKTMPLDTVHRVDGRTATHREIHNVYGMENARATYEGMLRLQPNLRPFVLTRAGFAGTQRYAAAWTGDNAATWTHYRLTVPTLLSLGISGMPFVGVDVGGFAGSPTPELLTRWMELGAFLPFYRNHTDTGTADQEPWVHGPEHEAIRRRYIETRYRLLPYIYTQTEEASRDGVPLMRPMFLEFPEEASLVANDDEFMLGDALLVAPKLKETLDPYEVKLPPGQWYDYWNGDLIEGGKNLKVNPPLDTVPVYVRAGAILPHQPLVQNTAQTPQGALQLRVYPGENCHGSLYQDDGSSFAYAKGQFLRINFSCQAAPRELRVRMSATEGAYKPWWNTVQVQIVGMTNSPREVKAGGKKTSEWKFDAASKSLVVTIPAASQGNEVVIIE